MIRKARFPADQGSVLHARRLVSDAVVDVPDHVSEALALITSELATNAVRHGPSGFEIRIEQRSDCIHIEVEDDGGGAPIVRAPGLSETSGRGLQIVGALADEWGVIPRDGSEGKTVWARVTLPAVDDRLSRSAHGTTHRDDGGSGGTTGAPGTSGSPTSIRSIGTDGAPARTPLRRTRRAQSPETRASSRCQSAGHRHRLPERASRRLLRLT